MTRYASVSVNCGILTTGVIVTAVNCPPGVMQKAGLLIGGVLLGVTLLFVALEMRGAKALTTKTNDD